jgi:hypothetical protein
MSDQICKRCAAWIAADCLKVVRGDPYHRGCLPVGATPEETAGTEQEMAKIREGWPTTDTAASIPWGEPGDVLWEARGAGWGGEIIRAYELGLAAGRAEVAPLRAAAQRMWNAEERRECFGDHSAAVRHLGEVLKALDAR